MTTTTYALTTDKLLLAVLWHLYVNDWDRVDINKLTEAYEAYQERFLKAFYGPDTKQALEDDIGKLIQLGYAQRTVGRVMLTQDGMNAAIELTIHDSVEDILNVVDEFFSPGGPP